MQRWIRYLDGQFGGVYVGDIIEIGDYRLDKDTPDEILFEAGVLRLVGEPPEHPDVPYTIIQGPFFKISEDGSATVTERYTYRYETFEEIKRYKMQEWYFAKDIILKDGLTVGNITYDLRFRNLAYLSIMSTLIASGKFPENFHWFDVSGNRVLLSKDDCLELIEAAALFILDLETRAGETLKALEAITDRDELARFDATSFVNKDMYNVL